MPVLPTLSGDRFDHLDSLRSEGLARKREHSTLTMPSLLPFEGRAVNTALDVPYNSLAAEGVNNLASRIMSVVFPLNGQSIFEVLVEAPFKPEGKDDTELNAVFGSFEESVMDTLAPTNMLLEPNVSESQFNVTVTVEKIEFAETETRVYMRIDNGTEQTVRLNDGRMKLSQGPKESGLQPDPAPDYDRLPADLPTEMSATGILTFPPASYEEGSLKLTIGASTDDYALRFEPFELAVVWTPSAE